MYDLCYVMNENLAHETWAINYTRRATLYRDEEWLAGTVVRNLAGIDQFGRDFVMKDY